MLPVLRFHWPLFRRTLSILVGAGVWYTTWAAVASLVVTILNPELGKGVTEILGGTWVTFSRWWSLIPLGILSLLFVYGLMKANHERFLEVEKRRNDISKDRDTLQRELTSRENRELATQERWRAEDALEAYYDQMERWVLDEDQPLAASQHGDPHRKMARTRTLAILKRLDPNRKRDIVQFLYEHGLIDKENPVIGLHKADLSNANLADMSLMGINLRDVNLSGADMSRVPMCGFVGRSSSWGKAIERGGGPEDLMQPTTPSDLSGANLSGVILKRAVLTGCNLIGANFADADLGGTDVRGGADLRLVRNLTQEQIEQAYGSAGQQEYMPDTLLPDHLKAPEAWKKLLSQQRSQREQTQSSEES